MSWLFSQALVAEFSAATSWDGAPSAPLSVMPTQHKFWRNDKTMDVSQLSRFGLTCAALTEDRGEALLTWFRADSRVRTYPLLAEVRASKASAHPCGSRWAESFVRYDPKKPGWKTHQCLWEEDLPWSSVSLPRWGMTRNGYVFQQLNAGLRTYGTGYGWLLPTPTATDYKGGRSPEAARLAGRGEMNGLRDFCRLRLGLKSPLPEGSEELMGWPIGWTDLKPLEMARFQEWWQMHSPCSQTSEDAA